MQIGERGHNLQAVQVLDTAAAAGLLDADHPLDNARWGLAEPSDADALLEKAVGLKWRDEALARLFEQVAIRVLIAQFVRG